MSEPEAVTRARRWIPLHRENRYQKLAAQIMTDLLAAYDELARVEAERFLSLVDVTNRCMVAIKERDELVASVRERESAAWDAAVSSMRYEDGTPVEVVATRNPYRERKD